MEDHVSLLRDAIATVAKAVSRARAKVVNRHNLREQVRNLVKTYFETRRPRVLERYENGDRLQPLDTTMQELLTFANARTLRTRYRDKLKDAQKQLNDFEAACFTATSVVSGNHKPGITVQDRGLVETLDKVCPAAAASYAQGLDDLVDQQRQSWRGTATEFRETLREALDHLAPDQDVKGQPGFKLEKDRDRPTMKQKVVFILKSRRASSAAVKTAKTHVDLIEEKTGSFIRSVYDLSSASTHGSPTRDDAISIRDHLALILSELLQVPR